MSCTLHIVSFRVAAVFLLLGVLVPAPVQARCWEFARLVDTSVGRPGHPTNQLEYDLRPIASLTGWKEYLLSKLWAFEAARGYRMANFYHDSYWHFFTEDDHLPTKRLPLPYLLRPVRGLVHLGLAMSHAQGLSPARRYGLLPLKYLTSGLIQNFYSHAFLGLALGGAGPLMDALGVSFLNPTFSESGVSGLQPEEVVVYVSMGAGDPVMDGENAQVASIVDKRPDKFRALDLTQQAGTTRENARDKILALAESLKREGKLIKKLIVLGHGKPGVVNWTARGLSKTTDLDQIADYLHPLRKVFAKNPQVFFNSCLLAADFLGRKQVETFAKKMVPPGGFVEVNILYGIAGAGLTHRGTLVNGNSWQKALTLYNPVLAEGGGIMGFYILDWKFGGFVIDFMATMEGADVELAEVLNGKYRIQVKGTEAHPELILPDTKEVWSQAYKKRDNRAKGKF